MNSLFCMGKVCPREETSPHHCLLFLNYRDHHTACRLLDRSTAPYGIDPSYVKTSRLFNQSMDPLTSYKCDDCSPQSMLCILTCDGLRSCSSGTHCAVVSHMRPQAQRDQRL